MESIILLLLLSPIFLQAQPPTSAAEMPQFPGGEMALYSFMSQHLTYPPGSKQSGMHGCVYVQFTVGKDGSVKNVEVLDGISKQLDEMSVNVVKAMPKWIPGRNGKKDAEVRLGAAFDFQLKDSANKEPKILSTMPEANFKAIVTDGGVVFSETLAQFPGGIGGLKEYIRKNEKYPVKVMRQGIQGIVKVQFTIDTAGNVSDARLRSTVVQELDNEALRVIENMPKWKPATMNGQPVKSTKLVPLHFFINQEAY